jgi:rhodanese-related sulfurtransferase
MRRLLALSVLSLLAACGNSGGETTTTASAESESTGAETASSENHFAQISVTDVASRLGNAEHPVAVFDANHRETFDQHHVPGATWVHYDSVTAETLPADHATSLVFYCANEQCEASHVAANTAAELGFTDVSVMGAGIEGWVAAGQPVETAPAAE